MFIKEGDLVSFKNTAIGKTFCSMRGSVDVIVEEGAVGIVIHSWEYNKEARTSPSFQVMVGEDLIDGLDIDDLAIKSKGNVCLKN